jgi:hypothetical protein
MARTAHILVKHYGPQQERCWHTTATIPALLVVFALHCTFAPLILGETSINAWNGGKHSGRQCLASTLETVGPRVGDRLF